MPVGHEELDVVRKAIHGDLRDGQRLVVAPQVDEAEGQFAGDFGGLGVQAHASHGHSLRLRDEALSALGAREESEGLGHVVPV